MEAVKLTMVNRDNERRHEVTERAQKQLDSFARDAERKLSEKMELMSENKEANIKALQHRLQKHVCYQYSDAPETARLSLKYICVQLRM